jgi:hypothetical protein
MEQKMRHDCLHSVRKWNTTKSQRAVERTTETPSTIAIAALREIGPVGYRHINFRSTYRFSVERMRTGCSPLPREGGLMRIYVLRWSIEPPVLAVSGRSPTGYGKAVDSSVGSAPAGYVGSYGNLQIGALDSINYWFGKH